MNSRESYTLYLQVGLEEYKSQESQNREFSIKTLGITAYCITVASVVQTQIIDDWTVKFIVAAIAVCLFVVLWNAFQVLRPADWKRPVNLEEVEKSIDKHSPEKTELGLAIAYRKAVRTNWTILDAKAQNLDLLSKSALLESLLFVILFCYLLLTGVKSSLLLCTG